MEFCEPDGQQLQIRSSENSARMTCAPFPLVGISARRDELSYPPANRPPLVRYPIICFIQSQEDSTHRVSIVIGRLVTIKNAGDSADLSILGGHESHADGNRTEQNLKGSNRCRNAGYRCRRNSRDTKIIVQTVEKHGWAALRHCCQNISAVRAVKRGLGCLNWGAAHKSDERQYETKFFHPSYRNKFLSQQVGLSANA